MIDAAIEAAEKEIAIEVQCKVEIDRLEYHWKQILKNEIEIKEPAIPIMDINEEFLRLIEIEAEKFQENIEGKTQEENLLTDISTNQECEDSSKPNPKKYESNLLS